MRRALSAVLACLAGAAGAADKPPPCAVAGDVVHWRADYCMFRESTDDFLQDAVQACYAAELRKSRGGACAAKRAYKRALCRAAAAHPPYNGSIEACVRDPGFAGPTVRNGGV